MICPRKFINGLYSINLNTFTCSSLPIFQLIGGLCQACKLGSQRYFIHGGRLDVDGYSLTEDAYIINLKENTYEIIKNGPCMCSAGSVKKGKNI